MSTIATYTFDVGLVTPKDEVRSLVGDVSPNPQWFLADQTIEAYLASYSFNETCAQCCISIAGQCNQLATTVQQRNLRRSYMDRAKTALEMAKMFRDTAPSNPGEPQQTGAQCTRMVNAPTWPALIALPGRPCREWPNG